MSKAYWGVDQSTGRYYAMTNSPLVTQWGATEEEAKKNLTDYLEKHHGITIVGWESFPKPEPE
jgi:hypothetical protein